MPLLDLDLPAGRAAVALGSNLGDRRALLVEAIDALTAAGVTVLARSHLYDTEPVGPPQPRYLNAAVLVATERSPEGLLELLLATERAAGRDRSLESRHGPRRLDLDLLLHGDARRSTPTLTLPHPRMLERTFVLAPLVDLLPEVVELGTRLGALGGPPRRVPWSCDGR